MKKILLFASVLTFVSAFQAQNVSINKTGETVDISGTEILVVNTGGLEDTFDLEVLNTSSQDLNLKIQRVRMDVPSNGWSDFLCWQYGAFGYCYTPNANNPWTTNTGLVIPPTEHGSLIIHINPDDTQIDYGHYRYYVLNQDTQNYEDSIDIKINPILTVKETKQQVVTVYPNPADNYFTISIPNGSEGFVKLTDVLGKSVYDERLNNTKKLDVSTFKNGVYVATINVNGVTTTKRFVVKH